PSAMPVARPLPAPAAVSGGVRYASFGARAAAAFVDFVILQIVSSIINAVFLGVLLSKLDTTTILIATIVPLVLDAAFTMLYSVWLESSKWQATPGKMLMHLKVVDVEGRRISFGRSSWRNFAKGFSMLTLGVGYLMPLWTRRRQALHDQAAGCCVVRSD
ncbi:MAG TPA: RDD family protein, partial [Phycisphaerae bacterium]|nr:RDD family protein [Phycisphaerae bacterium]